MKKRKKKQPLQKKNYEDKKKKKGSKRPLNEKKKRKGKCEKGGITIMDQPINLPSQFISLRWALCRDPKIQNIPFRVPKSCETSDPFIPPRFPASPPLHKKKNYFPSDPFQSTHAE